MRVKNSNRKRTHAGEALREAVRAGRGVAFALLLGGSVGGGGCTEPSDAISLRTRHGGYIESDGASAVMNKESEPPPEPYFNNDRSPESFLYNSGPGTDENPSLDCEDIDAVVAACRRGRAEERRVARCTLRRNPSVAWWGRSDDHRDSVAEGAYFCENSPWCTRGRGVEEMTDEQRRYEACDTMYVYGPCRAISSLRRTEGGTWERDNQLHGRCVPTRDELTCACHEFERWFIVPPR